MELVLEVTWSAVSCTELDGDCPGGGAARTEPASIACQAMRFHYDFVGRYDIRLIALVAKRGHTDWGRYPPRRHHAERATQPLTFQRAGPLAEQRPDVQVSLASPPTVMLSGDGGALVHLLKGGAAMGASRQDSMAPLRRPATSALLAAISGVAAICPTNRWYRVAAQLAVNN